MLATFCQYQPENCGLPNLQPVFSAILESCLAVQHFQPVYKINLATRLLGHRPYYNLAVTTLQPRLLYRT
jgi:hypothetical protein